MPIKLVPKQYDALVERVRDALARIRAQERAIMQLCVRDARMPRADFLREFPNNETNLGWAEAIASGKSKYAEAIAARKDDIRACQQKLVDLEQETGLSVADVRTSTAACPSVRPKPAEPRKRWSRPTCAW